MPDHANGYVMRSTSSIQSCRTFFPLHPLQSPKMKFDANLEWFKFFVLDFMMFSLITRTNSHSNTLIGPKGRMDEKRTGTKPTAPTVLSKLRMLLFPSVEP